MIIKPTQKFFKNNIFHLLSLFLLVFACNNKQENINNYATWNTYRGTPDASQFSSLSQIDTANVHLLEPAWIYHTGDVGERTTIECNPIMIDGILYVTSPKLKLIALEAATGKEIWTWRGQPGGNLLDRW